MGARRGRRRGWQVSGFLLIPLLVASNLVLVETASGQTGSSDEPPRKELPEERTATSRTFRNRDGSFTTQFFEAPVHYREAGQWRPIRSDLVPADTAGYAWRNEANSFDVLFKGALDPGFLRFGEKSTVFDLSLASAAAVTGQRLQAASRITYPGIFPSVELQYDVLATGVKETLILADATTPTHYRFVLTPPDGLPVEAQKRPDGSWAFLAPPNAGPVFVLEAPYAFDATTQGIATPAEERHASLDVTKTGRTFAVDLLIDEKWLHDAARQFPVRIDPTITFPALQDARIAATCPDCTHSGLYDRLFIGTSDTHAWRAALIFDLANAPTASSVTSARLRLFFDRVCITATTSCRDVTQQLDAHRMTADWTTATTNSQISFDPTPLSSFTLGANAPEQWMSWDITNTVKNWLAGTQPNHGLLMKRSTEPLGAGGPAPPSRLFSEPALGPQLEVTYSGDAVDLDAVDLLSPDTLHANGADLDWTRYTGPSGAPFERYEVHRGTSPGFAPSAQTLLATIIDIDVTSYRDTTAAPSKTFTYRVVANSSPSIPRTVTLPADGQATKLLQPGPPEGKGATFANWEGGPTCPNYGAQDSLIVGTNTNTSSTWRTALWFDLGDVPTEANIGSATLSLWQYEPAEALATVNVHRVTRSWAEGSGIGQCTNDGITWNQPEGGVSWSSPGGDFDPTPAAQVSKDANEGSHWDNFNVTQLVQTWVSGQAPNLGVILRTDKENRNTHNDVGYRSDDYTITPGLRPKLAVTYADGSHALGPTVAFSKPIAGSQLSGVVKLTAAASDDRRVESVTFCVYVLTYLCGPIATDTTPPFEVSWDTSSEPSIIRRIAATATDDAGNKASHEIGVFVANSYPPTTSITSPAAGSMVKGTVTVKANAADDISVDRVEFYFDGNRIGLPDTKSPYTISWNTLDAAEPAFDGSHDLTTRAYDTHGQMTASAKVTVTVANTAGTKYRAGISASTAVPQAMVYDPAKATQDKYGVTLSIKNNSTVTFARTDVVLRYRWIAPNGTTTTSGDILFPSNLAAGATTQLTPLVEPPALAPGSDKAQYALRFDLYDKPSASYFAAKGNPPLDNPVIVNKAISAAALGLERYYQYDAEPLGAGMVALTNVASGNSLLSWTPFSSPGRGLSTVVGITYNSLEDHSESPIGSNFSLSISSLTRFGLPLDVHPNKADEIAGRSNKYIEFTDGDGTTHRFTQNANGGWDEPPGVHLYLRQYSSTDPSRKWALTRPDRVTFFYNDLGFPTFVQDRNGNELRFTLEDIPPGEDPGGVKKRVTQITDAAGLGGTPAPNRTFTIDYYSKAEAKKPQVRGKIEKITDHNGSALVFDYYEDGNLLRLTQKGGTNADGTALADRSFVFTYTTSDGSGPAISDPALRVNPDPATANQSARLFSVRDPNSAGDPNGKETTFSYFGPTSGQLRWKLQTRTNRSGAGTSYAYDLANKLTTVTAPLSRVTKYTYDFEGKVTRITNPKDEATTLLWDDIAPQVPGDRQVIKVTEPTQKFTEFAYNDNGYLTDVWDQLRNRTTLEYQNVAVDASDIASKWKTGRTIPHISQLVKKTSPRGTATGTPTDDFQWSFGYDPKGNLTSVTEPEGSPRFTTTYTYNPDGTLATITDANTHRTSFNTYDANGLVTKITDAKNQVTQFGYDDDGLLRFVQDPLHASYTGGDPRTYRTYFDYDSFHRMGRQSTPKSTAETAPLIWTALAYDANDNVTSQFAPAYGGQFVKGPETKLTYDPMDRVLSSSNPQSEKTEYLYDGAGRLTRVTSPKGVATTGTNQDFALFYDYDPLDRVIRETRYDTGQSPTKAVITHFCYDLAGDLRTATAPKADVASVNCATPPGFTTSYDYDDDHRLKKQTDPLGHATSYTYDADGNLDSMTNASNDTTVRTFDQRGLLSKVVEPLTASRSLTTMYRYDGVGNLVKLISPRAYDASSDKVTFTQYVTTNTYDALNQLITTELPSKTGETKAYVHRSYDANRNLQVTTLPDPASTLAGVPADSKVTSAYFDTGWVKSTDDHVNPPASYDYNERGQQTFRRSGSSRPEIWVYEPDGMLVEHKDRETQGVVYTYDANNNLTSAIDRAGITTPGRKPIEVRVTYDALDRVAKVRNRNEGDTNTNYQFTTFSYDLNSNVIERADNGVETESGTIVTAPKRHTFVYDQADWLTTQLDFLASGCQKVENTFTPMGWEATRLVSRATQACDASPSFSLKQSTQWTYLRNGKLDTLSTRSGAVGSGPLVESHDLDYVDAAGIYVNGNRVSDVFTKKGPNADCNASSCTETYTYDGRDRLTQEQRSPGPTITYTLDPASNITKKVTPSLTTFYTYSGQRLDKVAQGTATNFVARYAYDGEGNLDCVVVPSYLGLCEAASATQLIKDYAYDYLNRMAAYQSYASGAVKDQASYVYDPLDRVLQETEKHGSSPTRTTDFTYLGLTNLVTQESQTGDPTKDAIKSYSYDAYGNRISLRNDPVDSAQAIKDYTYVYDVHGSVSALIDSSQNVVASYGYEAYGGKDAGLSGGDPEDNNPLNPYRYSARRFDSGSGTIDMGARRFGPDTARFLQPDLYLGALTNLGLSTDLLTGNRYSLAGGNPLSFLEWDGHRLTKDGQGGAESSPNPSDQTEDAERFDAAYAAYAVKLLDLVDAGLRAAGNSLNQEADDIYRAIVYGFDSSRPAQTWYAILRARSGALPARYAASGVARVGGAAVAGVGAVLTYSEMRERGYSQAEAVAISGGGLAGSIGGAKIGALMCAAGTPLVVGICAALGGVMGGLAGAGAVEILLSEADDWIIEHFMPEGARTTLPTVPA
jgi:RHS repeat-associated protein